MQARMTCSQFRLDKAAQASWPIGIISDRSQSPERLSFLARQPAAADRTPQGVPDDAFAPPFRGCIGRTAQSAQSASHRGAGRGRRRSADSGGRRQDGADPGTDGRPCVPPSGHQAPRDRRIPLLRRLVASPAAGLGRRDHCVRFAGRGIRRGAARRGERDFHDGDEVRGQPQSGHDLGHELLCPGPGLPPLPPQPHGGVFQRQRVPAGLAGQRRLEGSRRTRADRRVRDHRAGTRADVSVLQRPLPDPHRLAAFELCHGDALRRAGRYRPGRAGRTRGGCYRRPCSTSSGKATPTR